VPPIRGRHLAARASVSTSAVASKALHAFRAAGGWFELSGRWVAPAAQVPADQRRLRPRGNALPGPLATLAPGQSVSIRLEVEFLSTSDDNRLQGLVADAAFTWSAKQR
jgi:hypothetical protein